MVTLFRVYQNLCKQGKFSFSKHRAPSLVCIDDNRSCIKHWKSGFFFIDRQAILDVMVLRHLDAAIDYPRPTAGSFNMFNVRRLSVHVIKLRDMPEGVLVLSGLSYVWMSCVCDPVLWGADGNGIGPVLRSRGGPFDVKPTLQKHPFYCTPSVAADVVIPDHTSEDLAVGTPSFKIVAKAEAFRKLKASTSGATSSHVAKRTRTRVGAPLLLLLKALTPEGKGIMVDDAVAPSADSMLKGYEEKVANMTGLELQVSALKKQVSRLNDKLSSSYPFFAKSKAKGKERKKKIKSLTKSLDNLHTEVARLSAALNQLTILEAERDEEILRLKTTPPVQGELLSLAASVRFERGLSMHRTKDKFVVVLKKMVNFMPGAQDGVAEASYLVAQTNYAFLNKISEHAIEPLSESTVTPASKSLELSTNVDPTNFVVASKHNKEMVSAEVDGSDPKMTDDTINVKFGHDFMHGMFVVLDDAMELAGVGSGCVSSGPNDVVVSLFVGEKGDGITPFFVTGKEAVVNPSRVYT
nr:hypothetical protein [Tanacetum cinerariifolium]